MTSRYPLGFLVFSVLVGAICVRLGIWQLDRLSARRTLNAVTLEQRRCPPAMFGLVTGPVEDRRVFASGRFDFGREFVLRGRAMDGVPGVEVVTPLLLSGSDSAVLVMRGYVPAADAMTYDGASHRETDSLQVAGIAMPVPVRSGGSAPSHAEGQ